MLVPIIRFVAAGAALYFAYRAGVEDGKSQAHWERIKESYTASVLELKSEAEAELKNLEKQFSRLEAREGEYASTEGVVRDEVYRQLSEKIEAKKKHIESLDATMRAL